MKAAIASSITCIVAAATTVSKQKIRDMLLSSEN
jgi:hypothetical protein